jgi:hypothetical protein
MAKEKKFNIILDVLCSDKFRNDFMHYTDVFEEGKQLAEFHAYEIEATGNPNLNKFCENFKNSLEEAGKQNVVFVAIRKMNDEFHPNYPKYFKPNVQTLSIHQNGTLGWTLFKNILKNLQYNVTTDERMRVISIE